MKTFPLHYRMKDWKETPQLERSDGPGVTRVEAEFAYQGDTKLVYIMHYYPDQTGSYTGYEQFDGAFDGQPASVLLRHEGKFDPKGVDANVTSVARTGTGSLTDVALRFATRFEGHDPYALTLEVE
jgi:hypothetical protein